MHHPAASLAMHHSFCTAQPILRDPIPSLSSCKDLSALSAHKVGLLASKRTKSLAARDTALRVDGALQEDRLGVELGGRAGWGKCFVSGLARGPTFVAPPGCREKCRDAIAGRPGRVESEIFADGVGLGKVEMKLKKVIIAFKSLYIIFLLKFFLNSII
jgi:hypothetical protein